MKMKNFTKLNEESFQAYNKHATRQRNLQPSNHNGSLQSSNKQVPTTIFNLQQEVERKSPFNNLRSSSNQTRQDPNSNGFSLYQQLQEKLRQNESKQDQLRIDK